MVRELRERAKRDLRRPEKDQNDDIDKFSPNKLKTKTFT